ncbi:MAG: coenzyme F420-0:L-glutamate ligase [Hyphomonadaceae bacterium]
MIEIHPITAIGEVRAGDDLAATLAAACAPLGLRADDILVVTQKIVSKAEGRFVDLAAIKPSTRAVELAETTRKDPRLVELVLAESSAVIRAVPNVLITRHKLGFVMANAGIDRSNLGPDGGDLALLLPENPDASAAALARALDVAVVISDSFGRPWRVGVVNVALGSAGLPALWDRRGETDRDGCVLEVTQVAIADLVASAAGLAMGEAGESVPAALVRGYAPSGAANDARALIRPPEEDLFR